MRAILVTGTTTGIGKTITTAAIARAAASAGVPNTVVKPVQTGTADAEPTDAATIRRLSGLDHVVELVSLAAPLAPDAAARLEGRSLPDGRELAAGTVGAASDRPLLLVEGAGGVLVRLDSSGGTLLDLGRSIADLGHDVGVVVVTSLALGTLNHTELTTRAITAAGLRNAGLVVGASPVVAGLAERFNRDDLADVTGVPLLGELPSGAGAFSPEQFQQQCRSWLPGLELLVAGLTG